ncbi:Mrp/NBP35 family ATP-binding protein [Sorangium sp. So ce291]|uniref:Mrp/NBP35 family ATP-binding protein n=1 Tax=Sorangium sp. So ce291 TaxID=3133294 RepID=UPI003F5F14B7
MPITKDAALAALAKVTAPDLQRPLTELGRVRDLSVEDGAVSLTVELTSYFKQRLAADIEAALKGAGAKEVRVAWDVSIPTRTILPDDPSPGVRNIVLVMSGKGGVGKSTVAANLTLALSREGAKVGLLDADMYGPSVPTMLGVMGRPTSADGQKFLPLERFGVKLMSIGFLLEDPRSAVVWRGPMLQNALIQFMRDVEWGELDYLVLDLPPGTGDIALTISQKMRTTGAIVVTTPQEVALQDVYKSVSMAQKVGIALLGVVENESYFVCDGCSKRHELFGAGGGQKIAEFAEAPLLGQIPMDAAIREWGDAGTPVVQAAPGSPIAGAFLDVAERLAAQVSAHNLASGGGLRIDRSGGTNKHLPIMR